MTGIGLELTASAVRAVRLDRSSSSRKNVPLTVQATLEVPCDTSHPDHLTQAFGQIRRTLNITQPVVLGVPMSSSIVMTVTPLIPFPPHAIFGVQFELQQQLPFSLNEALWHYWWLPSSHGSSGDQASRPAVVGAIRRVVLEGWVQACRRVGLTVKAVVPNPVALLNFWGVRGSLQGQGRLLSCLDDRLAEWVSWSRQGLQVVVVEATTADQLVSEALASLHALQPSQENMFSGITVVGTAERSARVLEGLKAAGASVELFDVRQVVVIETSSAIRHEPSATLLGLALQGMEPVSIPLDLTALVRTQQRAQRFQRSMMMVRGSCLLLALGVWGSGLWHVSHARTMVLQALESRERTYQKLRPDIRSMLQTQTHLEARWQQLRHLRTQRAAMLEMVALVSEALPDQVWLTKLEWNQGNGVLDGLIEGRATSFQGVTVFLENLKRVAKMTTVKPLSTTVTAPSPEGTDGASDAAHSSTAKEVIVFSVQVQRALEAPRKDDTTRP